MRIQTEECVTAAEAFEMRLPCGMIGIPCQSVRCQLIEDTPQP